MKNVNNCAMKSDSDFSLLVGPSDLCFDRNVFVKSEFSVDQFLQSHKKKANLETMRDDLGVYLKVLRSAMIELINKDYADFVNLSSNLIGLDKAIHGIEIPLGQLKEEILQVKQALDDAMNEVSSQLSERRLLRSKKYKLQSLVSVSHLLKKMNHLLQDIDKPISPAVIERAASEYNHLQFALFKCGDIATDHSRKEAEIICNILSTNLDRMFLKNIQSKNIADIAHCLRIYMTLNRIPYAEELLRKEVVAPSLNNVICENTLHSDPRNLQGVYSSILSFIDTHMKELLEITLKTNSSVTGFDFLVNSFWCEVEQRLEMHLASIYAPGNPEIFYKRYCETLEFLKSLDGYCNSPKHIKILHSHPQYIQFLERWNLPVYFQIRFQEIAGSLENVLSESSSTTIMESSNKFKLLSTSTVWEALLKCWCDGIFLIQLGHRFWKLNLQILARYYVWIGDISNKKSAQHSTEMNKSVTTPVDATQIQFMVYLYMDIEHLASNFPMLEEKVLDKLQNLTEAKQQLLKSSLEESRQQILSRLLSVSECIINEVASDSLSQLRQVNDIPRLFRRTNREVPTKPCAYVAQVLAAPKTFLEVYKPVVEISLLQQWLEQIFNLITEQYYSAVNDVLTSVQKTEESLRRLKKLRDRSATHETRSGDDDKIRQQLVLDVDTYSSEVIKMGVKKENVQKLDNLLTLVNEAQKQNKL